MIEQRVNSRPLAGWRGIALVAAIAAGAVAASMLFSWMGRWIGGIASALYIVCGIAAAAFLLNRYVMGFRYTLDGNCLRVTRTYGRYERAVATLWLNGLVACGTPEEIKARCPGARTLRAARPDCPIQPLAVAYGEAGKTRVLVLQPDAPLRDAIVQAVKRK